MNKLLLFFLITGLPIKSYSQPSSFLSSADSINSSTIVEKVYLHIDRTYFISKENIWFKAYLVDASTNKLIDHSKNMYVELIDLNSRILQKRLILIDSGVGFGDFQLSDSIASGRYIIRAYTNWMRNFDDLLFFEKEISIVNSKDANLLLQKEFASIQSGIDIQFFPEGGSMIDSIPVKLAFKAVDSAGVGCGIKGSIKSNNGEIVATFESSHLGMGALTFTPYSNHTYIAEGISQKGQSFSVELPKILKKGITLELRDNKEDKISVVIKTNNKTLKSVLGKVFRVRLTSRNEDYLIYDIKIASLVNRIAIPTDELPEGICRLTLIGDEGIPQSERLVYIDKDLAIKISISPDKNIYTPRSAINLTIMVKDTFGTPEIASISLSAVDTNFIKNDELSGSNILSYLLLESEVKGYIEKPNYYFDLTNTDRLRNLDFLLLTQGWRDFVWKQLPNPMPGINYPFENGLVLSGKLRRAVLNKPIDNANMTLTLFDSTKMFHFITKTDALGHFRYDSLLFLGNLKMILSAKADNKRLQEMILLDSAVYDTPPFAYSLPNNEMFISTISQLENEDLYQKWVRKKYLLRDTIMLNELKIIKKIPKNQFNDKHRRIYSRADEVIVLSQADAGRFDIFQLLQGRSSRLNIRATYESGFKEYIVRMKGASRTFNQLKVDLTPLCLLDGCQVSLETLKELPVSIIDKVEILDRGAGVFGGRGAYGVISVFTKDVSDRYSTNTSVVKKTLKGYDPPRVFYAPKYDKVVNTADSPDLRNTIHWEPNIVTENEDGEIISFFNADKETTVEVRIEGITRSGTPITGSFIYQVKGKKPI